MIRLTQRQIDHGVFALITAVSVLGVVVVLLRPALSASIPYSLASTVLCGGLWASYWRGWRYARPALVVLITGSILALPLRAPEGWFSQTIYMAPALATVLTGPLWILASGVVVLISMIIRAHGAPIDPSQYLIYAMVLACMVFSRLAVDNVQRVEEARRDAEAQRAAAEAQRHRAEQQAAELAERNRDQERLLELVATLETPSIPVAEGILLAPIVGALDSRRAQVLTRRLLDDAATRRARRVILDIAGVTGVDTQVAHALLDTTRALQLLGCAVTLTGVSPLVATTITHLGVDLATIDIARSPEDVLARPAAELLAR